MIDRRPPDRLKAVPITATLPHDWTADLARGDIVAYRFPERQATDAGPKARPCLVIEISSVGDKRFITLAYGSSGPRGSDRRYEVRVDGEGEPEECGLARATRFQCMTRLTVSIDSPAFQVQGQLGTPVLGRLNKRRLAQMHAVRARLYAEADIAAERRAERRRERVRHCAPLALG